MTPWLDDGDVRIYVGDAIDVLRAMPDGSVDCCVTSPPYWGLRDYGTGSWDGGDVDCDHRGVHGAGGGSGPNEGIPGIGGQAHVAGSPNRGGDPNRCRCGARRVDQQLGLETTPDEYVANMVAVFREVRRVLSDHGTLWLNLGDSYAGSWGNQGRKEERGTQRPINGGMLTPVSDGRYPDKGSNTGAVPTGLKPKDLVGIPWRVAFALQADGWYLRSDIIWAKPNPMPESVTDRPTKAHEYVFLLSKRPKYFFDQEAVREPNSSPEQAEHNVRYAKVYEAYDATAAQRVTHGHDARGSRGIHARGTALGRNVRSVWEIATQPYPDAHFATFPEELPRRCILAGCPEWVCGTCGKARERLLEKRATGKVRQRATGGLGTEIRRETHGLAPVDGTFQEGVSYETVGWSDCGCSKRYKDDDDRDGTYRPGVVLDPFLGSGTTALVARNHGRRCVGIELSPEYADLAAKRLQQLSLLADGSAA